MSVPVTANLFAALDTKKKKKSKVRVVRAMHTRDVPYPRRARTCRRCRRSDVPSRTFPAVVASAKRERSAAETATPATLRARTALTS